MPNWGTIGGLCRFSRLALSSASSLRFPTSLLISTNTTALQGSGALKGCAHQVILLESRVEEHGLPGAGHSSLLRSRGKAGEAKCWRILLGTPQVSQGEIPTVWGHEAVWERRATGKREGRGDPRAWSRRRRKSKRPPAGRMREGVMDSSRGGDAQASDAAPAGVAAGAPPPLPRRRRRRRPVPAGFSPLASAGGSIPMNSMAASGAPSPIR